MKNVIAACLNLLFIPWDIAYDTQALDLFTQVKASAHYPCSESHGHDGNVGMTAQYAKQSPKFAGQSESYL